MVSPFATLFSRAFSFVFASNAPTEVIKVSLFLSCSTSLSTGCWEIKKKGPWVVGNLDLSSCSRYHEKLRALAEEPGRHSARRKGKRRNTDHTYRHHSSLNCHLRVRTAWLGVSVRSVQSVQSVQSVFQLLPLLLPPFLRDLRVQCFCLAGC